MAAVGLLTSCTGEDPRDPDPVVSASALAPHGDVTIVEPLSELAGATWYESAGVRVAVPDGWEASRTEEGGATQMLVEDPSGDSDPVSVAVEPRENVDDSAVSRSALDMTSRFMSVNAQDVVRRPAEFGPWPYAEAVTGSLELAEGGVVDVLSISTRFDNRTAVVVMSARAPQGELEDSVAYDVLRTVGPTS